MPTVLVTSSEKNLSIIAKAALYTSKFWWVCKVSILDIPDQGTKQTPEHLRKQQNIANRFLTIVTEIKCSSSSWI